MKALVLNTLKQPLELQEVAVKQPEGNQVVAVVRAAALNHRDVWIKYGRYPGITLPTILGSDGLVEHEGVAYVVNPNIQWGKDPEVPSSNYKILGLEQWGTMAEQITIARDRLHPKPVHLTDHQAAALPLGGLTAYRALF